ncbi:MAG TPA: response regulator [Acidimicrobiales bacterium]|nr:response regulator [Acidimicrobiales bacterium]
MALVLVVDDEPDIRDLVRMTVEFDGHAVLTACDGAEALDAVRNERPDLVILDVMMPEKDGWQVLEAMKADREPEVSAIPVILLTARSGDMDRIRGGIEGAVRYLTKPFSPEQLREEVNEILAGEPEPVRRRRAQNDALEHLARLQSGSGEPTGAPAPRPHITRLGRAPEPPRPAPSSLWANRVAVLSERQLEVLRAVGSARTVSEAAEQLTVSRSNVYASLRRIARRLDVHSVAELVNLVRSGTLPVP